MNSPNSRIFRHEHRVTYSECTIGNHVYYSRYLDFLEEARGEFFRSLGRTLLDWQQADLIFPVLEVRVRYKTAARYDDRVLIELWLNQLKGVRLGFEYRLTTQDRLLAEAATSHVFSTCAEKPRRPPPELCELLDPFVHPATLGMEIKNPHPER